MKFGSSNILGLAIDDRQIVCAEVSARGGVVRTARFDRASSPTTTFAQFLKLNSLTASRAVVGLPARWLMAREKQIPPSSASATADLLRMQAERQFAGEAKAMAFDFAGEPSADEPRNVLLLATLQEHIDEVNKIAEEAELQLIGVTSSTLALSNLIGSNEGMLLSLGNESAELAVRSANGPRMLRHIATTNGHSVAQFGTIGSELLKAAAMGTAPTTELTVWDGLGLDESGTATIESRSGLKLKKIRQLPDVNESTGQFGPAVALAKAGFKLETLPINFVRSRLTPPKQSRFGRTSLLVAAVAVVVVCGIASIGWDIYSKSSQLDEINQRHDDQKDRLKLAQATIDRTNYARGWYDQRTPALDVLKAVTNAFPQLGDVWATTVSVHENGKGLLSGRAIDQQSVLRVIDAMKRDKRFTDVTLMDMRDAGGSNKDTVFSLTFTVGPNK